MKGIVLAGGRGTRLFPSTMAISKQLLPIYDKPLIYYPVSLLMLAGIRDIMLISDADSLNAYQRLFGDGERLGVSITYGLQSEPRGIAEAFIIGEQFIANGPCCLVLGDNIFYGDEVPSLLSNEISQSLGASIFGYPVADPSQFGVVEVDDANNVVSIVEKPEKPKSKYAVTGLYCYDSDEVDIAKSIVPSFRGELEITSINQEYLKLGKLKAELLGRGIAWFDAGTVDSMLDASNFISAIQKRTGQMIGCVEEVAFRKGWIGHNELNDLYAIYKTGSYTGYLRSIADG